MAIKSTLKSSFILGLESGLTPNNTVVTITVALLYCAKKLFNIGRHGWGKNGTKWSVFERGTCQVDSGTRANSNIFFRPQFLVRKQLAKIWKVPHFGGGQIKTTCLTRTLLIDMSYIHKAITYLKSTLQRKTLLSRVPCVKLLAN